VGSVHQCTLPHSAPLTPLRPATRCLFVCLFVWLVFGPLRSWPGRYFDIEFKRALNPMADGPAMTATFVRFVLEQLRLWQPQPPPAAAAAQPSGKRPSLPPPPPPHVADVLDMDASSDAKFSRHLIFRLWGGAAAFASNLDAGAWVRQLMLTLRHKAALAAAAADDDQGAADDDDDDDGCGSEPPARSSAGRSAGRWVLCFTLIRYIYSIFYKYATVALQLGRALTGCSACATPSLACPPSSSLSGRELCELYVRTEAPPGGARAAVSGFSSGAAHHLD
jgi:hypothetical protein